MFFFPLSLIAAGVIAWRSSLWLGLVTGTVLFAAAIMVAWRIQGFEPSPRDLLWLALVWVVAGVSAAVGSRRPAQRRRDP